MTPLHEQPEIYHRRWFLLGVMCLSLVMVVMSAALGMVVCGVGGKLEALDNLEDARELRVEEGGEGERGERSPEEDGEEFGHWWKTSTLPD